VSRLLGGDSMTYKKRLPAKLSRGMVGQISRKL
jgi:hypothetical protein